jgi:hypothetical protein
MPPSRGSPPASVTSAGGLGNLSERALGFFHLGTGLWLFYLMFAVVLDFTVKWTLQF